VDILLIHNSYQQLGGEDSVFAAEAALLEAHGHRIIRYTASNAGLADVNRFTVARRAVWSEESYADVRALLRTHRPQIVHIHNTFPRISPSVCHAARAEGVPVVQTLHNYRLLCPNGLFFRRGRVCEDCLGRAFAMPGVAHACYRRSHAATAVVAGMLSLHRAFGTWARMVDMFIAPTEFARQKFIAGGIPAERIVVKPNFIRHDPGLGKRDGGYALFVGRLSSEKGVETLLAAWQGIGKRLPLKVVGDGPLAGLVQAATEQDRFIHRLGWQPEHHVRELMRDATLLVFPSMCYETFGLVIAEAFAAGLPVVASNLGIMSSLVVHGRTGLHFRPGDAADLSAQIEWALDHPDQVDAMSAWARQEYETCFTPERNYELLMTTYETLLGRSTRRRAE
jgi:glycosyltransferase involved in cell wall biosynthesis